jgi:hypothetical protein
MWQAMKSQTLAQFKMVALNTFVRLCKRTEIHLLRGQPEVLFLQLETMTQKIGIFVEILQTMTDLL